MSYPTLPAYRARRGAALPLVAVSIVALMGMAALAVDLGMAYTAHSEAQRIADASSLAGGSAFLDTNLATVEPLAEERAYDYALRNAIRGEAVDSSEVTVQVIVDSMKVRVFIRRETLPTWFARLLGVDEVDVGAVAAAQAFQAGEARCLKPFAVPDVWFDSDDDANGNRLWDPGEEWEFDPTSGDRYDPFIGQDDDGSDLLHDGNLPTGYGSLWRNDMRDYGRRVEIKLSDPNSEYQVQPGLFLPWRIPVDEDQGTCDRGGGGGNDAGASAYRNNICECNNFPVELGVEYDVEPGNMIGPTNQGIEELIAEDPGAVWDPGANDGRGGIVDSEFGGDGMLSPRVVKVGLFDPTTQLQDPGMQPIVFNNFALFFLEGQASQRDPVVARFLYYATGTGEGSGGPNTGSLVLYLRLVE